jgi:hypothetical protein
MTMPLEPLTGPGGSLQQNWFLCLLVFFLHYYPLLLSNTYPLLSKFLLGLQSEYLFAFTFAPKWCSSPLRNTISARMQISDELFSQTNILHQDDVGSLVCLQPHEQFFSYPSAVTITGDRAANLDPCLALMTFSSEGSFSCRHLLRHGTSVYTVSSEGPASIFHSEIRTRDARITRSLRLRSNHCATRAARRLTSTFIY